MAKKQPGTMLYFDIRPCLKRLTAEEKGVLFEAILDYGELGLLPELDGVLGVAWDFVQPRLDRDRERYEEISQKRTAAVNARWERERQLHLHTNECTLIQPIPTTSAPTASNPYTPSSPAATRADPAPSQFEKTADQQFEDRRREAMNLLLGWSSSSS